MKCPNKSPCWAQSLTLVLAQLQYHDVHVFLGHWNLRNMSPVPSVEVGEIHTPFCPTLRCDHTPALMPFLWNCLHHQGQILLSTQNTHRSFQTVNKGKWIWMDLTTNLRACRSKNWVKMKHPYISGLDYLWGFSSQVGFVMGTTHGFEYVNQQFASVLCWFAVSLNDFEFRGEKSMDINTQQKYHQD